VVAVGLIAASLTQGSACVAPVHHGPALPSFGDVAPNGIVETLRLQSRGFLSVEL